MVAEAAAEALVASEADLLYEEDLLRNAYSLRYWLRYIEAKKAAPARQRNLIAERALKYLPGAYKIWRPYLNDRRAQVKNCQPGDAAIEAVNRAYERALVYMNKMPRLWEDYLAFLMGQAKIGFTRHAFDRALKALPITQHERVWPLYLEFAKACPVKETAVRVYRRYLQFEPDGTEEYIEFLLSIGRVSEAALKLAEMLNREHVVSTRGKSRHALWMELCELVCKNPQHVKSLRVEAILRSGLRTFTDEAGHLWCALADFFLRQAAFEQARDVYEEAIASVVTVRDFSMVFDAYSQVGAGPHVPVGGGLARVCMGMARGCAGGRVRGWTGGRGHAGAPPGGERARARASAAHAFASVRERAHTFARVRVLRSLLLPAVVTAPPRAPSRSLRSRC